MSTLPQPLVSNLPTRCLHLNMSQILQTPQVPSWLLQSSLSASTTAYPVFFKFQFVTMPFDYLKMNTNSIFSVVTKIFALIPIFFSNWIQLLLKFFNNRLVNVYLFTSFPPLKENLGFSLSEFFYLLLWYFFSSFFSFLLLDLNFWF